MLIIWRSDHHCIHHDSYLAVRGSWDLWSSSTFMKWNPEKHAFTAEILCEEGKSFQYKFQNIHGDWWFDVCSEVCRDPAGNLNNFMINPQKISEKVILCDKMTQKSSENDENEAQNTPKIEQDENYAADLSEMLDSRENFRILTLICLLGIFYFPILFLIVSKTNFSENQFKTFLLSLLVLTVIFFEKMRNKK